MIVHGQQKTRTTSGCSCEPRLSQPSAAHPLSRVSPQYEVLRLATRPRARTLVPLCHVLHLPDSSGVKAMGSVGAFLYVVCQMG